MAIKVFFEEGGAYAEVENAEQAATLLKEFSKSKKELTEKSVRPNVLLSEDVAVKRVLYGVNLNAKSLLIELAQHKAGIKGEKFADTTGVSADKLGGVLGGISKIAKKYGRTLEEFVISETRTEGTLRFRFLAPGTLLLKYVDILPKTITRAKAS